jgi:signal transduction histidine kinase
MGILIHGLCYFGSKNLLRERRLRLEIENALRARDEFLSIACHEMRNPLTSLQLNIEMLSVLAARDGLGSSNPVFAKSLEAIRTQIDRQVALVGHLLDFSRLKSGKFKLDTERVELKSVLEEVINRHLEIASEAGSPVHLEAPANVTGIWDRIKLEQIFSNLLANAIKYGRSKPISVKARVEASQVHVSVSDQGIGIAHEHVTRIFERFERVTPVHKQESLGLGLYIVKQLVEAHGGKIKVESTPGAGSTFTVTLPVSSQLSLKIAG